MAGAGLLVFVSAILWTLHAQRESAVPLYQPGPDQNYLAAIPFWEDQIRTYGGVNAYERFDTATQLLSGGQKHAYAHMFGEALYKVEGLSGIGVCDMGATVGCYHEFFGSAFADLGLADLPNIAADCETVEANGPRGCAHGVGHAILTRTGYTKTGLTTALALCDKNFTKVPQRCWDGVFMEYMVRDIGSGGLESSTTSQQLTSQTRYAPCAGIADKYLASCAYELPHWWDTSYPETPAQTFDERLTLFGTWCDQFQSTACMQGTGFEIGGMTVGPAGMLQWCSDAARVSHTDSLQCLAGAARRYHLDHPKDPLLCGSFYLAGEELQHCIDYATFKTNNVTSFTGE